MYFISDLKNCLDLLAENNLVLIKRVIMVKTNLLQPHYKNQILAIYQSVNYMSDYAEKTTPLQYVFQIFPFSFCNG